MKRASVIIPAYKAEKSILRAVESALSQGDCAGEVIVVIDGVYDETRKVLQKVQDRRLKIKEFHDNKGAQFARNEGLKSAAFDYIIFLDSDDYFEGKFLQGLLIELASKKAEFCVGVNCLVDSSGEGIYFKIDDSYGPVELLKGWLLGTCAVGPTCILWQKPFVKSIGGWDERVARNQDGELVIRALVEGAEPCFSEVGAGCTVQHDGHRISRLRTKESFMTQAAIYHSVISFLENSNSNVNKKKEISAALGYFCISICVGMAESGFKGSDYRIWKKRVNFGISDIFRLPKSKALQALLFIALGSNAFRARQVLKRYSLQK